MATVPPFDLAKIANIGWDKWVTENRDPVRARVQNEAPVRQGGLRGSVTTVLIPGGIHRTRVLRVIARAHYALWVTDGTGPHLIRPRTPGGVLAFLDAVTGDRRFARSVRHPGTVANPFIERGIRGYGLRVKAGPVNRRARRR